MAGNNTMAFVLAVVVIAACLSTSLQLAKPQDCGDNSGELTAKCGKFVQKPGPLTDPSTECCDVVKRVDIPCVCAHITPPIEEDISMEKVVYVAKKCGRPLKSGSKCGSYTVP